MSKTKILLKSRVGVKHTGPKTWLDSGFVKIVFLVAGFLLGFFVGLYPMGVSIGRSLTSSLILGAILGSGLMIIFLMLHSILLGIFFTGFKETWTRIVALGILGCVLIGSTFIAAPFLGQIFKPPVADYSFGYARILCYDSLNGQYVNGKISLFHYENESLYRTEQTNKTFYISNHTLAYIEMKGYYNITVTVLPSGASDENNPRTTIYYVYKVCPKNALRTQIIRIGENYGNFTAAQIPNGVQEVWIDTWIVEPYKNHTVWGYPSYYPRTLLPHGSYAKQYNLTQMSAWIAWNGTIKDIKMYGVSYDSYKITGNLNCTFMMGTVFRTTHKITADFRNIKNLYIYFGLIDNYTKFVIKL